MEEVLEVVFNDRGLVWSLFVFLGLLAAPPGHLGAVVGIVNLFDGGFDLGLARSAFAKQIGEQLS